LGRPKLFVRRLLLPPLTSIDDPEDDKRYLKQMDAVALKKLQEKGKELEKRTGVLVTAHVAHGDVRYDPFLPFTERESVS
jgi:hypothetical protein